MKKQLEAAKKELEKRERTEAAGSQNSEVGVAMVTLHTPYTTHSSSLGASKSVHL
jgi:hypothetical protein